MSAKAQIVSDRVSAEAIEKGTLESSSPNRTAPLTHMVNLVKALDVQVMVFAY